MLDLSVLTVEQRKAVCIQRAGMALAAAVARINREADSDELQRESMSEPAATPADHDE